MKDFYDDNLIKTGANPASFIDEKTDAETGFGFLRSKLDVLSPLGTAAKKQASPFLPGQEELLEEELSKVESLKTLAEAKGKTLSQIRDLLHMIKDVTGSVKRAESNVLSVVELYEIKSLLIYSLELRGLILEEDLVPEEFKLRDSTEALDILDPRGDRINTFYIYDDYSQTLANLRAEKKEVEDKLRTLRKTGAENPVSPDTATENQQTDLVSRSDALALAIEEEEAAVRKDLSKRISGHRDLILENCNRIGRLDYVLAKTLLAMDYNGVCPIVSKSHVIRILGGRHLQLEEILKSKGKKYMPISMDLNPGVTCITGANMGGKTVSLKMAGLISIMTQYGYFVPAERAEIGLSGSVRILIGDNQSLEKGLSGFGSEMEGLRNMLEEAKDRALILIDEIAGGTNPTEGQALTVALVEYLREKPYICLLTTHYELFTNENNVRNIQVRGLLDVDFEELGKRLKEGDLDRRIDIIGEYMDYTLMEMNDGAEVPKDAINIARMLGLPEEIIRTASMRMNEQRRR